jgi:hypothetical protein
MQNMQIFSNQKKISKTAAYRSFPTTYQQITAVFLWRLPFFSRRSPGHFERVQPPTSKAGGKNLPIY